MGGEDDLKQMFRSTQEFVDHHHREKDKHEDHQWMMNIENDDDDDDDVTSTSDESSFVEDYSRTSSSSSDLVDDASSSSTSSNSNNGPLYELSELMAQLPIKRRGLSKYFEGKSQSFTCVSSVGNIGEFAKKESGYRCYKKKKKMKGGLINTRKLHTLPTRATISKKLPRNSISSASLCFAGKTSCRPPLFPVPNNNFSSV